MTAFDKAFDYTMVWEGGSKLTNDHDDPGGLTRFGISKRSHPDVDIENPDGRRRKDAVRPGVLGRDQWESTCKSERLAIKVFDVGVNMGTVRAVKFLGFINSMDEIGIKIVEDGRLGAGTLAAIDLVDTDLLLELYVIRLGKILHGVEQAEVPEGLVAQSGRSHDDLAEEAAISRQDRIVQPGAPGVHCNQCGCDDVGSPGNQQVVRP